MYANRPQNTTSISDLPDLEDIESNLIGELDVDPKYQKFIRTSHQPLQESGMYGGHQEVMQPLPPPMNMQHAQPQALSNHVNVYENLSSNTPSCLDVCSHVMNCPICSKFYNNDRTIYIMAIVVLTIVCVILLKKVLDI